MFNPDFMGQFRKRYGNPNAANAPDSQGPAFLGPPIRQMPTQPINGQPGQPLMMPPIRVPIPQPNGTSPTPQSPLRPPISNLPVPQHFRGGGEVTLPGNPGADQGPSIFGDNGSTVFGGNLGGGALPPPDLPPVPQGDFGGTGSVAPVDPTYGGGNRHDPISPAGEPTVEAPGGSGPWVDAGGNPVPAGTPGATQSATLGSPATSGRIPVGTLGTTRNPSYNLNPGRGNFFGGAALPQFSTGQNGASTVMNVPGGSSGSVSAGSLGMALGLGGPGPGASRLSYGLASDFGGADDPQSGGGVNPYNAANPWSADPNATAGMNINPTHVGSPGWLNIPQGTHLGLRNPLAPISGVRGLGGDYRQLAQGPVAQTKKYRYAGGGRVPGLTAPMSAPDSVSAMLKPGEVVLNTQQQKGVMVRPGMKKLLRPDEVKAIYAAHMR